MRIPLLSGATSKFLGFYRAIKLDSQLTQLGHRLRMYGCTEPVMSVFAELPADSALAVFKTTIGGMRDKRWQHIGPLFERECLKLILKNPVLSAGSNFTNTDLERLDRVINEEHRPVVNAAYTDNITRFIGRDDPPDIAIMLTSTWEYLQYNPEQRPLVNTTRAAINRVVFQESDQTPGLEDSSNMIFNPESIIKDPIVIGILARHAQLTRSMAAAAKSRAPNAVAAVL